MTLNIQEESELSRCAFEILGKAPLYFVSTNIFICPFSLLVPGSERIVVSCPSREERVRLVELLQKQIRNPVLNTSISTIPSVSRPPLRMMTRYLIRLIKAGLLTRLRLREILDGGKAEHERRLLLGCTLINPTAVDTNNLSRFVRQCRVECHMSTGQSSRSSPQSRSLYVEKEFTLRVPFVARCWNRSSALSFSSSTSSTSSSSSASTSLTSSSSGSSNKRVHWSPQSRIRRGLGGSLDSSSSTSSKSRFPSRSQSLPPLDLCISRSLKGPSTERTEVPIHYTSTSTTVGAWVSNFSFDSGLADVGGGVTPSQSRDATGTPSETDISITSPVSSPAVYRSTLYAHWWRKAKVSASVVLAQSPTPPVQSPAGKGMERSG